MENEKVVLSDREQRIKELTDWHFMRHGCAPAKWWIEEALKIEKEHSNVA